MEIQQTFYIELIMEKSDHPKNFKTQYMKC